MTAIAGRPVRLPRVYSKRVAVAAARVVVAADRKLGIPSDPQVLQLAADASLTPLHPGAERARADRNG